MPYNILFYPFPFSYPVIIADIINHICFIFYLQGMVFFLVMSLLHFILLLLYLIFLLVTFFLLIYCFPFSGLIITDGILNIINLFLSSLFFIVFFLSSVALYHCYFPSFPSYIYLRINNRLIYPILSVFPFSLPITITSILNLFLLLFHFLSFLLRHYLFFFFLSFPSFHPSQFSHCWY